MSDKLSVQQCLEDISTAMTFAHEGEDAPDLRIPDQDLENFAKICSLMTDKEKCLSYLAGLNTILLDKVNLLGMRRRGSKTGLKKRELKKHDITFTTDTGATLTQQQYNTNGILSNYLDMWEASNGFNRAAQEEGQALPPGAPELTAFVAAGDFRKYLLKHGYHWTDMAVAASHGDFTHRLHWYIICEHHKSRNGSWLSELPVEVFKKCGLAMSVNPNNKPKNGERYTVWDQLFDNTRTHGNRGNRQLMGRSNVYRCPENFHADLKTEAFRKRKDLWVVCQIIYSRANRVATVRSQLGNSAIDDKYRHYEDNDAPDNVVKVGYQTGMGGAHPGTIMWNNVASNKPVGWDEDLVIGT